MYVCTVIAKTASRNVAFKATRVRDSIMEGQDRFIMRKSDNVDVDLREDCEEDLADVGHNADLYVVNQESTDLIREAHMGDVSFSLKMVMGHVKIYFIFSRLVLIRRT